MSREIGIDLGTTNVVIHLKGRGIVFNEPSVLAIDKESNEVIAVGKEAYELLGRTGASIDIIQPLQHGVIADYEMAELLLIRCFQKVYTKSFFQKPRVMISRPAQISDIEQKALVESIDRSGAGKIYMDIEPKVAGIGAGISINDPSGNMVIDIGGGTTDIAILAGGDILHSNTLRVAGDDFDQAIIQYFRSERNLLIGKRSAENIKILLASAIELDDDLMTTAPLKGRDLITGLPKSINATSNDIYHAIHPLLDEIAIMSRAMLEDTQPEIASDIIERGIILTGGGALISGIDTYLSQELNVSTLQADQPMNCVAIGTGIMLDMLSTGHFEQQNVTSIQKLLNQLKRIYRRLFG